MQRFLVPGPLAAGEIDLPQGVARQAATVLRMRPGDALVLFDGRGGEWQAELVSIGRDGARARVIRHVEPQREAPLHVVLCQALLKADKFEWVLQKGTELGISAFVPVITQRVVAGRDGAAGKLDRWRRIVAEAAEQSGRTRLPTLEAPRPLGTALAVRGTKIMCWEEYGGATLRDALAGAGGEQLAIFIGPEGGFAPEEAAGAERAGARLVSLGPRILRSETAALAAAAVALLP